jgi:thioredoxin reductase
LTPAAGPAYDVVVVGGGPAGLSAALWLCRYRRRTLVVDSGEQRNRWVDRSHGYLGSDPDTPSELLARARRDLGRYPEHARLEGRVSAIEQLGEGDFAVTTDTGVIRARRVLLATGIRDEFPDVDGFAEHYGADVFHCPACDGYEAKGKPIVVFGWSEHVAGFALSLTTWASSVTVVTDGRRFEGDDRHHRALQAAEVPVLESVATALVGMRGRLESVRLRDGSTLPCTLAFFSIAHHPRTALAESLGCELDEDGHVMVDDEGRTTVAGVYAAGDLVPGLQLVPVASATGVTAGVGCAKSLLG